MKMKTLTPLFGLLCIVGLAACNGTGPDGIDGDSVTLKMNRLDNGNLEYCDDAGVCQELPYSGDCAVVEVDVDTATGQTCQRCVLDDGSVIDEGCSGAAIGCVVVTLPEPDCVVCAYVEGSIIFSSCTADEPQCTSDDQCPSRDGLRGVCNNGECGFDPQCYSDADCPGGFTCDFSMVPAVGCPPGSDAPNDAGCLTPPDGGICVPAPRGCTDNSQCAAGQYCEYYCWYDCASEDGCIPPDAGNGSDAMMPPEYCEGYCVQADPCAAVDCAPGYHCELQDVWCITEPCEPVAACVPDTYGECGADYDCPPGHACVTVCTAGAPTDPNADPMPPCYEGDANCGGFCESYCEPVNVECFSDLDCVSPDGMAGQCVGGICYFENPYCYADSDCPQGHVCEYYDGLRPACDTAGGTDCLVAPGGICVPAADRCQTNEDCISITGDMRWCVDGVCVHGVNCDDTGVFCDMIPPVCPAGEVPSAVGGCYGPCVPAEACWPVDPGCQDSAECAPGESCVVACYACPSNDPTCIPGCEGWCEPTGFDCNSDLDCTDAGGMQGTCWDGWCVYEQPYCSSDAECGQGQRCDFSTCGGGGSSGEPGDPTGAPIWCGGVCVDDTPPPPTDCFRTGCSGELCADEDIASACVWLPEFACYDRAVCERQADGACGFTQTEDLQICLDDTAGNGTP